MEALLGGQAQRAGLALGGDASGARELFGRALASFPNTRHFRHGHHGGRGHHHQNLTAAALATAATAPTPQASFVSHGQSAIRFVQDNFGPPPGGRYSTRAARAARASVPLGACRTR